MVTDINTDPGCGTTMDPDLTHDCSSGPYVTMAPGSSTSYAGLYGSASALPSKTNMALDVFLDYGPLQGPQWQWEPWKLTQNLSAAGAWTQT